MSSLLFAPVYKCGFIFVSVNMRKFHIQLIIYSSLLPPFRTIITLFMYESDDDFIFVLLLFYNIFVFELLLNRMTNLINIIFQQVILKR